MSSRRTRRSALMQRLNPLVPMPPDGVEADPALGLDVQHLDPHVPTALIYPHVFGADARTGTPTPTGVRLPPARLTRRRIRKPAGRTRRTAGQLHARLGHSRWQPTHGRLTGKAAALHRRQRQRRRRGRRVRLKRPTKSTLRSPTDDRQSAAWT
ncbi:hypothetical protein M885DRAFT_540520, partial [Pelagophyceae sp. CCMP2097]